MLCSKTAVRTAVLHGAVAPDIWLGLRMIHWHQLPSWLFRAWPLLALLPAFLIHWLALWQFADTSVLVNKVAGMSLQALGGLLILYSINDNLGLFRRQSLVATVIAWFKAFPIARKPVVVQLSGVASVGMTGSASLSASTAPRTMEERLARLEDDLERLRKEVAANAAGAQRQLQEAKAELGGRIEATSSQLSDLTKKVEHAAVGGFKLQAFGVLLALYGAVTSVFA